MVAHRAMGMSLLYTGEFIEGREHLDQTITLYDTTEHRPLATRFGGDLRVQPLAVDRGLVGARLPRCCTRTRTRCK